MMLAQVYLLVFQTIDLYMLILSCVLLVYLGFRFYLLNKLSGEAKSSALTLYEFLKKGTPNCKDCKKQCDEC